MIDPDDTHHLNSLFYQPDSNGVNGYMGQSDLPLTRFTYDYALFWGFLFSKNNGISTIERIMEAFRTAGNDPVLDGPQAISTVLAGVPGVHDSFGAALADFAEAVYKRSFTWDGRQWGDLLNEVTYASTAAYQKAGISLADTVNPWAVDFLKVNFNDLNPLDFMLSLDST